MNKGTFYINIDITAIENPTPLKIAQKIKDSLEETLGIDFPDIIKQTQTDSNPRKKIVIPLPLLDGSFVDNDAVSLPCIVISLNDHDFNQDLTSPVSRQAIYLMLGIYSKLGYDNSDGYGYGFTGVSSWTSGVAPFIQHYYNTGNGVTRETHYRYLSYDHNFELFNAYNNLGLAKNIYLKFDMNFYPKFYKIGFALNPNGSDYSVPYSNLLKIASPCYIVNYKSMLTGKVAPGWFAVSGNAESNTSGNYYYCNVSGITTWLNCYPILRVYKITNGINILPVINGEYKVENLFMAHSIDNNLNPITGMSKETQTDPTMFDGIIANNKTYLYSSGDGNNEGIIIFTEADDTNEG